MENKLIKMLKPFGRLVAEGVVVYSIPEVICVLRNIS